MLEARIYYFIEIVIFRSLIRKVFITSIFILFISVFIGEEKMKQNESIDKIEAKKEARIAYFFLAPSTIHLILFFILPIILLGIYSFYRNIPGAGIEKILTLENYERFIRDPYYYNIIFRSLRLGAVVTLFTIILGYPFAYFMTISSERIKSICYIIVLMPLLTSVVVRTYGWMIIMGSRTGLISTFFYWLGITDKPIQLMYTFTGVSIALIQVFLPYMVLSIQAVLENIDKSLDLAAQGLGANRLKSFLFITFPLSIPGIISGALLVFALSIAAFITPTLIGGPRFRVMPTLIYEQAMASLDWPFGAAIAFTFLIIIMFIITIYNKITNRITMR